LECTPIVHSRSNDELAKEMGKYKADICALQEIKWSETVTVIKKKELHDFI